MNMTGSERLEYTELGNVATVRLLRPERLRDPGQVTPISKARRISQSRHTIMVLSRVHSPPIDSGTSKQTTHRSWNMGPKRLPQRGQ